MSLIAIRKSRHRGLSGSSLISRASLSSYANRPSAGEASNFADRVRNATLDLASIKKGRLDATTSASVEKIEKAVADLDQGFAALVGARERLGIAFDKGANASCSRPMLISRAGRSPFRPFRAGQSWPAP